MIMKRLYFVALEMFSEATKILKAEYLVKAIRQHRMDQAILFCRTKLDCDNTEKYLLALGGGLSFLNFCIFTLIYMLLMGQLV